MEKLDNIEFKNLDLRHVHDSWKNFFNSQKQQLIKIDSQIGNNFTPPKENIFKIFSMSIDKIRFVIVGQDPYPQSGHATGRSFERELKDWEGTNASLQAIFASIKYHSKEKSQVLAPMDIFKKWEKEKGVFFLNKSLTTEIGVRNGHSEIWASFTNALTEYLSACAQVKWLLWGAEAQKLAPLIETKASILKAIHPAAYSYSDSEESKRRLHSFIEKSGISFILD
ncbi:MAG: uracil-DNA glycosylase family protein [Vicingaceae bacterium]|jgi:uracil-DNA glycosylase